MESLVALSVLAVGATSLLAATEAHVGRIGEVEARLVARWVAADHLTARQLGLDPPDRVTAMGRDWAVDVERAETSDPDLVRLTVRAAPAEGGPGATLTGFADVEAGA